MARVKHYRRLPVFGLIVAIAATLALGVGANGLPLLILEVTLAAVSIGLVEKGVGQLAMYSAPLVGRGGVVDRGAEQRMVERDAAAP